MRIISFINQPEVIKKILQHLGLWEESLRLGSGQAHAPPDNVAAREITLDPAYSQLI
jgi:hypothetical protein